MPDNRPYIIAAFAITWIAIIAYALFLRRTRVEAERRLGSAGHSAGARR